MIDNKKCFYFQAMKTFALTNGEDVLMKIKASSLEDAWESFCQIKQLSVEALKSCKYNVEEDLRIRS